jgi:hypothetical protein
MASGNRSTKHNPARAPPAVTGEEDLLKCRRCAVKDNVEPQVVLQEEKQGVLKHKDEAQGRMELYQEICKEYDEANELDAEFLALLAEHDAWAKEEWAKSESRRPEYTESDEEFFFFFFFFSG